MTGKALLPCPFYLYRMFYMPFYQMAAARIFNLLARFTKTGLLLFAACLLLSALTAQGQVKNVVQFTHLTTANGLSQSSVVCILKDRYGFMWFGTQDGLNKYDGYKFKVYRNNPADKKSIPNNNIRCMLEDHAGNLWVGTVGGGLALYDRNTDSFIAVGSTDKGDEKIGTKIIKAIYEDKQQNLWVGTVSGFNQYDPAVKKLVPHAFQYAQVENINCIYEDSRENLWIGTLFGLNRWNKRTNTFKHFSADGQVGSISATNVNTVYEDKAGNVWIGTVDGLNLYDDKTETFKAYQKDLQNPSGLRDNVIRALCNAGDGKLWVATELALELFDPIRNTFTHFQQSTKDVRSLSSSSISSLLVDDQGILWVGTYAKGINKYDKNQFKFNLYKNFGTDALNINANIVTSFSEVPNGDIWIGTDGTGLYRWAPHSNKFEAFNPAAKENYFASLSVLCMKLSRQKDVLWVGTYDEGMARINLSTKVKTYYRAGNGADKLNNQSVYALLEDKKGNIWIGTNGGGVNVLNPATNQITHLVLKVGKHKNSANHIRAFYEDAKGNIWIGTIAHGVIVYNPATGLYKAYNKAANNLGSDAVFSIAGDSKGNIWVGTMGGGLCLFNPAHDNFTRFTESQGLANNIVNSIIEDKFGCLWLSTDKGISCFNPAKKTFKNYTSASGLQSNEFSIGAGYKLSNGEMIFGGLEGFNVFMPGSLKDNPNIPPVVITDFQLFNKPVPITPDKPPLSQNINTNREITLAYDQSVFTIEYAALGYTVPERNMYAYTLEGFDTGWNYVGTERKTTYTNLDPGTYTFRVKASNNDGLWNEKGTTLKIVILPPFWKTTWAYLFYIAAVATGLYLLYREIESREKLKSEVHYQKLLTEKTKELNRLKLNFFTNLSHELRTPLSLIVDPLRKIKNEDITVSQAKKYSGLVFNNASMLMNLVNQLLDFRKVETGGFSLDAAKTDVVALVKKVFNAFTDRARERNINFYLDLKVDQLEAWIDTDKLEKILYNLIPNAFKYTPDFGVIMILVKRGIITAQDGEQKQAVEIHIKDSGVGIPDELKNKIFDIFYQIKGSSRFENESSGIGLALTRELILLHNGEIVVADAENQGTDFIVRIPIGEENFSKEDLQPAVPPGTAKAENIESDEPNAARTKQPEEKMTNTPIVLIVEDNNDLREYVADELQGAYHIEQAADGVEGYRKAVELIPDIIISDIMMPGGDGLELCHKLKGDEKTSHIPIILLTAKQTDENKIEGYNTGADDYISKPFNVALLSARIHNILESRRKLREVFSGHTGNPIEASAITDIDKEFLRKVVKIIEDNLSYLNFDIDKLATALKMSRRQLYRKLSALTNQTAHDFITNTRLDHAAALLRTGEFTISEIGYKVGFSEPSNFSRSFTKKFGKSPKKYLSDQRVV
jgi:ligand-binding sensor domain-containing protein/signal transduction histidine kinase/DNA-binding response OmpR family regulator